MLSLLLSLLSAPSISHAWELTALGGFNYASPTQFVQGSKQSWEGLGRFSYGFFVADRIGSSSFSWETGIFFENSKYEQSGGPTQTLQDSAVPLMIQFHFDESVQMGAGYYRSWSRVPPPQSLTRIDSGLWFNIRARFHILPPLSLILEGRYQHGLANRAPISTDTYNTRSVQVLGGFAFSM